ncbi:MAG: exodeoxyribonuclease III [Planctomycetota bacterium]
MRIVTWNVNSVRARLPRLLPWLEQNRPDILCLQELKCRDHEFPVEPIEELGYNIRVNGQKTYNGVAILSREPAEDLVLDFPGDPDRAQRRVIAATIDRLRIINAYVVNGKEVGSDKYEYKLEWLRNLRDFVAAEIEQHARLILTGDFNITFDDRDVYDPEGWRDRILCSEPERKGLLGLTNLGLTDLFRQYHQDGGHYTWFDFRTRGFQRGQGLRIDHFLATDSVLASATGVDIDLEARGGEKPSDHAPVLLTLRDDPN